MLDVLTGINAERDATAKKTPKDSESGTDGPGHQARCVLRLGDHCLLAMGTHSLSRDVM